jgi:hypothetical protein
LSNHSYYVGANVNPDTNSFRNWMEKTNRLIFDMSTGVVMLAANSTGETTSGNGYITGRFGADTIIAGTALRGGTIATANTLNISSSVAIANTLSVANGITGDLTGTANNASNFNGQPASYYANATNLTSGQVPNARLPSANTTQQGIVQIVDSVSNTSITHAASANSVKQAYDAVTSAAATAYSNAVAFSANASNLGNGTVPSARLPTGNTTASGIVQLVDSYSNTSTTLAPTAKALNDFYQLYATASIAPSLLPAANTSQAGIVQLVDSVANTSTTIAPTANATKTAYDAAIVANTNAQTALTAAANATFLTTGTVPNARLNTANTTAAGIVQLSDSQASTSITLAATANSAKTAYDAAITANTNAANANTNAANATFLSNGTVAAARLPAANTTVQGAVIILDSVASTNVTVAAVPNSVKTAYDAAIAANTLAANAHTAAANASYMTNGTVATARLPTGNTSAVGIVQLVDSISNTSITIAPTANAVKLAYDAAINANTNAANATFLANGTVPAARLPAANTTVQGAVIIIDSISNTSVSIAPSANSVKTAYDAAITANTNAANATFLTNGTVAAARLPAANTTVQGAVIILDSVASTNVTVAAVPNSVKTAYDAAITANTNAANASFLANGTVPTARLATTLQNLINSTGISGNVTVSTSAPSGGANNDIWLERAS